MNGYLVFILAVLVGSYLLDMVIHYLNLRWLSPQLPEEFQGCCDAGHYERSQRYLCESTRFGFVVKTVFVILTAAFILIGGFNLADRAARWFGCGGIVTGLVFTGMLLLLSDMLHIPFSMYSTFVIESRYGFNRTSVATFIADHLKGWFLSFFIGAPVLAVALWLFLQAGHWAWLYCWAAVTVFQIFVLFIAPIVIMPIFNKFTPLPEGALKAAIEDYAAQQRFRLQGIYTMDGSRRSTKSNAFFTGIGRFRRIVLFDTLIEKHTIEELVAVLAHEVGHYKKGHIIKRLALSIFTSGIMFYALSFFLANQNLSAAFGMENVSLYATLVFFAFIYTPVELIISIGTNSVSRSHEFEADCFAAQTCKGSRGLISALKKMSIDNLANLTPHPAMVFFQYSHPPVVDRIRMLGQSD